MSSAPEKKKRGLWSEDSLVAAMASVIDGQLSQRQAAHQYKIPRRTLRNHLKSGKTVKKVGRETVLSKLQEKDLVERIIKFSKIGMPLTPKVIRTQAFKFCEKLGIKNSFNKQNGRAGKDWLYKFLKRNPNISKRKAQLMNPARAQKLNKPIVQQHFQTIKELYDEIDIINHPERLYNVDEKGCRLTIHYQQQVLAEKGNRRVHMVAQEHAENVSIAMCVNAAGNYIPPMIIFKGKRLKEEFTDNLPPGTLVKMAPKGSMTTSLFIEFIKHLGKYKSPGKCLLIFDGASCHLDLDIVDEAEKNDIVLYCLPSNTTHELQPLDKSVNKAYEHYWDQEVLKFMYHNPTRKIIKARFNPIFTKVWGKCMTPENVISGFRATGVFPLDPNTIPEDAYGPSLLTENQDPNLPAAHTSSTSGFDQNMQRSLQDESDTDVTDIEELEANASENYEALPISPSLLNNRPEATPTPTSPTKCLARVEFDSADSIGKRLVDYSSSNDPQSENEENVSQSFDKEPSPVPGPSGINYAIPRLTSDFSSSDSLDMNDFVRHQYRRNINNYDPYDDSDAEDRNIEFRGERTPKKMEAKTIESVRPMSVTDDSEDDVPLNDLKNKKPPISFKELIPTPNFAVVKSQPKRKALNYKGQKIVKDLFEKNGEKLNKRKKQEEINKRSNNIKKTKKIAPNKKQSKKKDEVPPKNKLDKRNVMNKKKREDLNDRWFCHACKLENEEDMRRCRKCLKWYHEECVGLTKADTEAFFCPDCV